MESSIFFTKKRLFGYLIIILSVIAYFLLPTAFPIAAGRSLLIFCCVALFWAFEILPLFVTSIVLVVLLTLFLTTDTPTLYFSQFANPIIFLFFGGFVFAKALSRHHIDRYLAHVLFQWIGTSSFAQIAGHLFLAAFLSMWMSNTAATVILLSVIAPTLSQLPDGDRLRKGLPLAIAFGASIGGIATPIGTPPNALVIGILAEHGVYVSFLKWMGMALPLAILIAVIAVCILWFFFSSKTEIQMEREEHQSLTKEAKVVVIGGILMIVLWLTAPFHQMSEALVALMGVCFFAAFGLITTKDLKSIEWDILLLMWGGLALGEAMKASGLISVFFSTDPFVGKEIWLFTVFCVLAVVLSSFMSNTAAANLLLPIIASFSSGNKILISVAVALCCSLALTFPIATPPNALAYSYHTFSTKDMFKAGSLISAVALILILVGFDFVIPLFIS